MLERVPVLLFLPLRLACGAFLAAAGLAKVLSGWWRSPLLAVRIGEWLQFEQTPHLALPLNYRLLRPVLLHMQHHAQAYSILISSAELFWGAALFVGLLSRAAALCGLCLTLLPMMAVGEPLLASKDLVVCAAFVTLSMCPSGRAIGLDGLLRR